MPELPEVETVARQLAPQLTGQTLRSLAVLDARLDLAAAELADVAGRRVRQVLRLGKQVVLELERPGPARGAPRCSWLAVHLRMTGRLLWYAADQLPASPPHLRARFELERGQLLFCDARRFGTLRLLATRGEAEPLGLDPLTPAFTPARLARLLAGSGQELKPWLLRQDRLVGLGNIYASEILHLAGLDPLRPAGSLGRDEVARLAAATRRTLERAIAACGTTFDSFQDSRGEEGGFQHFLNVYGKEGEPCHGCGGPIRRQVQQGRSTFWCPRCQGG